MAEFNAETYLRMHSRMRTERSDVESIWRACYEMTFPERADGLDGSTVKPEDAQRKRSELLDSTATDAARMLASQTHSGMTPANSVWALLDVGEETDEERRWLDHAAHIMWEQIHGSNYDSQKYEAVLDAVVAGWFVLMIDEDEAGKLHFQQFPLSQCYLGASKDGGMADILVRQFTLTATQAVSEYGEDNLPEKIREAAASGEKANEKFTFLHVIRPRKRAAGPGMMAKNLPIESVHVCCETKEIVRESGYHERPFAAPRWMQLPNSVYGVGPVSQALPAIRRLNKLLELEESALARAVAGVYVAEDDGVLNARTVRVRGGTVIAANSVDSIKPLPSGADFNVAFSKAEQMRGEIRRILLADQLAPQDGPAMTATEVHVRVQLIRQLMGPLYGRFQNEDLSVTIDRVFGLLYRRGRPEIGGRPGPVTIDDAPESLANEVFAVRYQSPLARAQKLDEVTAIERTSIFVQQLVAAGQPEAQDLIDIDEAVRLHAEGTGAPDKVVRTQKDVALRRKAREDAQAEQAQAAQQQQMQMMGAEAAMKRAATPA